MILTGDVLPMNRLDTMVHAVGSTVIVRHRGNTVGSGVVTDDDTFSIELADDIRGEIEILLGMMNAAPTLAEVDGNDLHIAVPYSNVNDFIG